MRLYIDTDTNQLISEPTYKKIVNGISFRRGDKSEINLSFVSGTNLLSATSDKQIIFGLKEALFLSVVRVFIVGVLVGNLLGIPFWAGLLGAVVSTLIMGVVYRQRDLSLIGVSILGAQVHVFSQILFIYFFLVRNKGLFNLVPWLWLMALAAGSITGFIAEKITTTSLFKRMMGTRQD